MPQRETIPFREIARDRPRYPRRAMLGLSLFIGQAFLYNAVTFDLGTILTTFFAVAVGRFRTTWSIFAAGNFLGPLTARAPVRHRRAEADDPGTYLGSAAAVVVALGLSCGGGLTTWSFLAFIVGTFFLASAGASSAYLTVSEIFPMETRALAIAFFYAVGTAVGGITGPLLFGHIIKRQAPTSSRRRSSSEPAAMAIGGVAELLFGVKAEQKPLEEIAEPLTAEGAEKAEEAEEPEKPARPARPARPVRRDRPGPGRVSWSRGLRGLRAGGRDGLRPRDRDDRPGSRGQGPDRPGASWPASRAPATWGPGRFRRALHEAVADGDVRRLSRDRFGPAEGAREPSVR